MIVIEYPPVHSPDGLYTGIRFEKRGLPTDMMGMTIVFILNGYFIVCHSLAFVLSNSVQDYK